jgi:hypothetical protein
MEKIVFRLQPIRNVLYHLRLLTMRAQGVYDLRDHIYMDVLTPEDVEVFVSLQAADVKMMLGKLVAHGIDVDQRIGIAIEYDDARRDIASRELGWAVAGVGALFVGPQHGHVEVIIVHEEGSGAHDLEPVYDGFCAGKGIEVGIGCKFLHHGDVMGVPGEEKDEGGVDEADKDGWIENGLP